MRKKMQFMTNNASNYDHNYAQTLIGSESYDIA